MGSLLVCWVLFPAVLGALSLGCGMVLELLAGRRLPDGILIPAGYATLIVVGLMPLLFSALATLIVPAVVAVAFVGLALGQPWRDRALGAPIVVGAIVLLVHGLPVVLNGEPAILGWFKLDDSSSSLAFVDRIMQHGRDFSGLAPSTYEATLNELFRGYPAGPLLPIGIGHALLTEDVAWLFQPSLAFAGAMLGMALWTMAGELVVDPLRRGVVAVMAAQPALLIGYAWWGGIKEVGTVPFVATAAVLAGGLMRDWITARSLLPLGVMIAAVLGSVSVGGVVWALPPLVPLVVLVVYRERAALLGVARAHWREATAAVAAMVVLALPALTTFNSFRNFGSESFSGKHAEEIARLMGRLNVFKVFGIWPAGDFRTGSVAPVVTGVLIGLMIVVAAAGVAWAWQRRAWQVLSFAFASACSALLLNVFAGPWIAGKALSIAAPAAPLLALLAVAIVYEHGRRIEAGIVGALLVAGIAWSNVLQYHAVQITPHAQFAELAAIGDAATGEGPTLMTEYNPYGGRHFLRRADGESASELRRRAVTLRTGQVPARGTAPDVDEIALPDLMLYRSLVLRRGPSSSRPPAPYRLVRRGKFYDLWQRPVGPSPVLEHLPLGGGLEAGAVPRCSEVLALARTEGIARLAAVQRDVPQPINLGRLAELPRDWVPDISNAGVLYPGRAGVLSAPVTTPTASRYTVWVGGSFRGRMTVSVDGRRLASERNQLNEAGAYADLGSAELSAGQHTVTLDYGGADWHPGSGGTAFGIGPVLVADQSADRPVISVPPGRARSLCGRDLDWVEALSS